MATTDATPLGHDEFPEILKAREVAAYLRVSYVTVLRMTRAGDLPAIRVGREFRYLRSEIEQLMRSTSGEDSVAD